MTSKLHITTLAILLLGVMVVHSQTLRDQEQRVVKSNPNKDKEKKGEARAKAKRGIRVWTINDASGLSDSVAVDTTSHAFQNTTFTTGTKGFYNSLGNLGSPRKSKLYSLRPEMTDYIFIQPYDFFIKDINTFHFTNTYSPITNITYHECGDSDNGEDHLVAKYATNINKDAGIGFNIDYIYGRGYYDNQSTADFGFNLYGSIIKDRYKAHMLIFANYIKTHENGGITDDEYVKNPQKFPTNYTTKEIPTNLSKAWNKMHVNGIQFNHRYSVGYEKKKTSNNKVVTSVKTDSTQKKQTNVPPGAISARELEKDEMQSRTGDLAKVQTKDSSVFIPVSSIIHTLRIGANSRKFLANQSLANFYTNNYLDCDSVSEHFDNVLISNYLGLELSEGLNKYLSAGIRLFAKHDFNNYKMPGQQTRDNFTENRFSVGAQIFREKSSLLNYLLTAQTSSDGDSWGEYELRGQGVLSVKLLKDTVNLTLRASSINKKPTFYYRHYQSNYLWWSNNLSKQLSNNAGVTLESRRLALRLRGDIYNITNYTYFKTAIQNGAEGKHTINTEVAQASKNISVFAIALDKDFRYGILNWENSIIWQTTNSKEILPLPVITAYTNLYLKFRIAKVLKTEVGADLSYFTKYYADTYSPALGLYANQPTEDLIKVGGHPIISVYANFHLKHTRFYLMASHLNYNKEGGTTFGAPHYPVNPFVIRFGLSWNFFN
ncbi:MAG: putative porin [Bacteroidaceae bacterium]|nr:putative porin [Prevotellaceae bacterium]MDY2850004.1 putative porin [Bacteroidaceae bacterium]